MSPPKLLSHPSEQQCLATVVPLLIKKALPLIPLEYIKALQTMINVFPDSASSFFVEKIIYEHFVSLRSSSGFFPIPDVATALEGFFVELIEQKPDEIIDYILGNCVFQHELQSIQGVGWLSGVPLIMSERDVQLILDIFTSSSRTS